MKYDLHVHTLYSKCSNLKPEVLLKIAKKRGMEGIAVTDHNTLEGAKKVFDLNKDKGFEVIVGEEITTDSGEVLAYYINENVKSKEFFSVIDEIKSQGGLAVVAHPFRTSPHSCHNLKHPIENIKNKINAIEVFNARNLPGDNGKAQKAAKELNIPGTAGSDTHFAFEIAAAYTIFEGCLREAIKKNKTEFKGTIKYGPFGGLLSFFRKKI